VTSSWLHGDISHALRICGDPSQLAPTDALQCDRTSDIGLDVAAVARGSGLRGVLPYLIHDRDSMFVKSQDESIARLGMTVLKSPFQSPTANAICERVIDTIRRECLDWVIPLSEAHLRLILKSWVSHYNRGRAHMSLGPGVPDPPAMPRLVQYRKSRHHLGDGVVVHAESILGGLHHEYSFVAAVA